MSQILTDILDKIRTQYVHDLELNNGLQPLLCAKTLCSTMLNLNTDLLAQIVTQDPTLLAARAGGLLKNGVQGENPSAALVIVMNIHSAALEVLLDTAVHYGWLALNEEGEMQLPDSEIEAVDDIDMQEVDYTRSQTALDNISQGGISELNQLLHKAETEYLTLLDTQVLDAYSLAIQVAGSHSVFTPQEIAPLINENPLLLALRADDLVVDEVFENDPPAGIIIGSHITQMVIDHLLDQATEKGALALDSQGQLILPSDSEAPVVH
ncbi:MAG: hypothetical protein HRU06_02800 [Oceanospirillaceae bacterium]|nr:hypothetical protein [Oceanospirillaceae bacterium]